MHVMGSAGVCRDVALLTSNTNLAAMPGNVFLPAGATGLPCDSVVKISGLLTL
jgi:mRNA interferase MazF